MGKLKHSAVFSPVDLDTVPEIAELLGRLGLGRLCPDSVTAPSGRNNVWAGHTDAGCGVFIKQLLGSSSDVSDRMARMMTFEKFAVAASIGLDMSTPRLLGVDTESQLVVFELLPDVRSGAELMVEEEFDLDLAARTGRAIGSLHATELDIGMEFDRSAPYFPSVDLLRGIPAELYDNATFGALQTWRLLQADEELIVAVQQLQSMEALAPRVPAHCDFRLDQILVSDPGLYLADWEEFRSADGARDVGAFAGEWLYRSILDIVTTRGGSEFVDVELTHEIVIERGTANMDRLLPLVEAFWQAYRGVRPNVDKQFAMRATAFAGWHLLDRLLVSADWLTRLPGISRAAAGVGRGALLAPEIFYEAIGFA